VTEPRTRTAAALADHAAGVVNDVQAWAEALVERLAAQLEDLAAVVAGQGDEIDHLPIAALPVRPAEPEPFPPVEWPITIKCDVDPDRDELVVRAHPDYFLFSTQSKVDRSRWVNVLVDGSDARLLAQAILGHLDGAS
jgi:hypothetical protein